MTWLELKRLIAMLGVQDTSMVELKLYLDDLRKKQLLVNFNPPLLKIWTA